MRTLAIACVALVAGCGGGGSDDSTPTVDAKAGGSYAGSFTSSVTGETAEIVALVLETGEAVMLSPYGIYSSDFDTDGNSIDASFEAFALWGMTWDGVNSYLHGSIDGTVAERSRITGEYTLGNDAGSFTLSYNKALYEQSSSAAKVSGDWGYSSGGYSLSLSIDTSGAMYGSDSDGCIYQGQIAVVDASYNAYRITNARADCPGVSVTGGSGVAYIGVDPVYGEYLEYGVEFSQNVALINALPRL